MTTNNIIVLCAFIAYMIIMIVIGFVCSKGNKNNEDSSRWQKPFFSFFALCLSSLFLLPFEQTKPITIIIII